MAFIHCNVLFELVIENVNYLLLISSIRFFEDVNFERTSYKNFEYMVTMSERGKYGFKITLQNTFKPLPEQHNTLYLKIDLNRLIT